MNQAVSGAAQKLQDLQMEMVDLRLTGQARTASGSGPSYSRSSGISPVTSRWRNFAPTDQDMEVQQILRDQLAEHLSALDALVAGGVADLNALLRSKGMETIGN